MKTLLFAVLFLYTVKSAVFARGKIDSVYYLLDTAKTPVNDRMWDIHEENPSLKFYVINCICLAYNSKPSFVFDMSTAKSEVIDKRGLRAIKLVSLSALIEQAKQFSDNKEPEGHQSFFLIEPAGKKYVVHKVRLIPYFIGKTVDFENISQPDSTRPKKQ